MKIRLVVLFLSICLFLSACNWGDNSVPSESLPVSQTTKEPITSQQKETPDYLDYSSHSDLNERLYKTVLVDLSKLAKGERVFALQEKTRPWVGKFQGFVKDYVFGYDVRSCDVSDVDFSEIDNFQDLTFDTNTVWPKALPEGFDPDYILEYNKNPGLGVRELHKNGITGAGISVAIIDQPLLLDHEQYKDNLMYYERIHSPGEGAQMHGPAVASIAVGDTIGVAPDAKLYYIATNYGHFADDTYEFDASIIADCVMRILDINKHLPEDDKIRVISISRGYGEDDVGYDELNEAIDKANKQNVFVLTTTTKCYYDFTLMGMGREYIKDPDDFKSYAPPTENYYTNPEVFGGDILVPMNSRTFASWTGVDEYAIANQGGLSWAVPWFAGMYALSCQVKPDITPQGFMEVVRATGVTVDIEHNGETYKFGKIVNPAEIIKQLQK